MEITSAEFVVSNSRADMCPQTNLPEYAFIGRSNVGKSSLINMLTKQPKLAMTSATPGKTLLINHFLVNKEWYLVDLPGYGYAQRGKKMMDKIQKLIEYYVLEREQMTCLFVLVDSRLEPQKIDLEFMEWLGENGVPLLSFYQIRQTKQWQNQIQCQPIYGGFERTMGRASTVFHIFIGKENRTKRNSGLYRVYQ